MRDSLKNTAINHLKSSSSINIAYSQNWHLFKNKMGMKHGEVLWYYLAFEHQRLRELFFINQRTKSTLVSFGKQRKYSNINWDFLFLITEMEIVLEGKNFRLLQEDELPAILDFLEKYLPDSLKVISIYILNNIIFLHYS